MDTGESTRARSRTDIVNITELEGGSGTSHSNRDNRKIWVKLMIIFIEVVLFVLFLGGLIASYIRSKNHEIWGLELWKWCVLVLVIVGGRCIMKLMMDYFLMYLIKKIFFLLRCKSSKVKRSKLDSNVQKFIMRSLATCVIGGFLWVLKKLLVNILTPPFQAKRLFDRFRESLIDQYILEVFSLKDSSVDEVVSVVNIWIKQNNLPAYECMTNGSVKVINWLKKIEPDEISAWAMKKLMELIGSTPLSSITQGLETLPEKENNMTNIFEQTEDVATQIFGSKERNVIKDLKLFKEEARDVEQHINGVEEMAGEEEIMLKRQRVRKWLANAIIERRSLVQSLEDSKRLRKELNKIVSGTVLILVFIIWLILLKILTTGALVVIITQFAALTFIFGDTLKSVFQGIIFVSVMHPFDIGDCCLIKGEEMVVQRINLLSTVFRKNVKDKIVYPNSVLTTLHIKNLYKGDRHLIEDSFEITIDSSTPPDRIDVLKKEIQRLLWNEEKYGEKWLKTYVFNLKEIKNRKLKIFFSVFYRKTELLSDWEMINSRRNILVRNLKMILENENEINGQENEEGKGKNKVDDGQTKEEKDKNRDGGRKTGKMKIKYYDILPKVVDAE
ncbi:hypothetical protein SLEP1_g34356 [Rubroshorea leprosula]|uniref:Mechanosensitive ion channel MscS domain-containing protein n=1 Tax=Rubroshorea leprosula TaxID=152421 RepID=A0AAV5KJL2_9ROSI|nr:hypothetical protein SLEP1_g34356 [Rubroshorea leprosula]